MNDQPLQWAVIGSGKRWHVRKNSRYALCGLGPPDHLIRETPGIGGACKHCLKELKNKMKTSEDPYPENAIGEARRDGTPPQQ